MRERQYLEENIGAVRRMETELSDNLELIELGEMEDDASVVTEAEGALKALKLESDRRQVETLLSGEADGNDSYVEIHAGAGGTESQDWANMLLRMYIRWAEKHGYKTDVLEVHEGEEAGIKSATVQIKGPNAYGWIKTESGVHRLVRISPYDSQARRHTSFASVWVYPVIDDSIDIEGQRERLPDRYLSRIGGRAASTSTRRIRPCASPTTRQASSCSARRNARSTRTGRRPGRC